MHMYVTILTNTSLTSMLYSQCRLDTTRWRAFLLLQSTAFKPNLYVSLFSIIHKIVPLTLYLVATRSGVRSSLSVRTSRSTVEIHVGTHTCRYTAHTAVLSTVMDTCMNTCISILLYYSKILENAYPYMDEDIQSKVLFPPLLSYLSLSLVLVSFPFPSSLLPPSSPTSSP